MKFIGIILALIIFSQVQIYFSTNRYVEVQHKIAYELNIDSSSLIQFYYEQKGYNLDFITILNNKIYAGAKENTFITFFQEERFDQFGINGTHLKKINYYTIPKEAIDKHYKVVDWLKTNAYYKY